MTFGEAIVAISTLPASSGHTVQDHLNNPDYGLTQVLLVNTVPVKAIEVPAAVPVKAIPQPDPVVVKAIP